MTPSDSVARTIVECLDLNNYELLINELAQFGDREWGTERNEHAVDWIEEQAQGLGLPDRAAPLRIRGTAARAGIRHEDRRDGFARDLHPRCAHGRQGWGAGGQRQRLRHGSSHGDCADAVRSRHPDGAFGTFRPVEQRRAGAERRSRIRGAARGDAGAAMQGVEGSAGLREVSRADLAGHGPATTR